MKGDWLFVTLLILVVTLFPAAIGADWLLWVLNKVTRWLTAWPPPDQHFAAMIGNVAWPLAMLLIVWLLRRPISRAAYLLAERMKSDDLKIGGFLQINAARFTPLDRRQAVEHVAVAPVAEDVDTTESLLEYAGLSEENAERVRHWIQAHHGSALDPEEFMTDERFANARHQAYIELVQGNE